MNKFFKILGKVTFISLIIETIIYGILGIGKLMQYKFGLCNKFTDFCDDVISMVGWAYRFTGQMLDK